jgi:putative hydrolase of the HAD superfamily
MPINVVTIDFWNTLFDSANGVPRNQARRDALLAAIRDAGHQCDDERFDAAYKGIWEYFDHHWLNNHRTPSSAEMVDEICRQLSVEIQRDRAEQVSELFSRGVLDHPPALLPGARQALEYLAGHAKLALISDTAFSPGAVLRELMESIGVARYFSAYIFSDETGVAKPHPEAFRRALEPFGASPAEAFHIGDIERTDIKGAKEAGMKAVLYRGDENKSKYAEEATGADAVMEHWSEIEEIFTRLSGERES